MKKLTEEQLDWDTAWNNYIAKLSRLEDLKNNGRYGYQLIQPQKAVRIAKDKLKAIDPDFCERVLGF